MDFSLFAQVNVVVHQLFLQRLATSSVVLATSRYQDILISKRCYIKFVSKISLLKGETFSESGSSMFAIEIIEIISSLKSLEII